MFKNKKLLLERRYKFNPLKRKENESVSCSVLSMELSRKEHWSVLPFPSPGDLSNPGTEPRSPALQADSSLSEPPGEPAEGHWSWLNAMC